MTSMGTRSRVVRAVGLAIVLVAHSAVEAWGQDGTDAGASPFFDVHELSDGVWAVIAADTLSAISNAGIVDLGDATVVFDAFFSPIPAESLRETAEALTGRSVDYLVLGHWHDDHIRGAQALPAATVVASEQTRELILTREPATIRWQRDSIADWVVTRGANWRPRSAPLDMRSSGSGSTTTRPWQPRCPSWTP